MSRIARHLRTRRQARQRPLDTAPPSSFDFPQGVSFRRSVVHFRRWIRAGTASKWDSANAKRQGLRLPARQSFRFVARGKWPSDRLDRMAIFLCDETGFRYDGPERPIFVARIRRFAEPPNGMAG